MPSLGRSCNRSGVADDYPYYGPLGAIIAMSTTVVGSIRQSVQGVLAILFGTGVASPISCSVRTSSRFPSWWSLQPSSRVGTSWAPWRYGCRFQRLYVLLIGSDDPVDYVIAYGGVTTLGAAIGIGVALLFPPLPLTPAQRRMTRLPERLADQLSNLADGLLQIRTVRTGLGRTSAVPSSAPLRDACDGHPGPWKTDG